MEHKLTIKTVIITGASSGIGFEIVKMIASSGVDIAMVSRNEDKLWQAKKKVSPIAKGKLICVPTDVRKADEVSRMVNGVKKEFQTIDCLINSAGVSVHGKFEQIEEQDWDEVVDTNLKGIFLCCKAVWPIMKENKNGHIITVSSASGLSGYASGSIYCASKFGVNGLMQALSAEGQEEGIKFTTICPGQVNTPIWNKNDPDINTIRADMLQPEAIAELVYYILTRPKNEHFRSIVLHPFKIQPDLRGKNRGPGGRFII